MQESRKIRLGGKLIDTTTGRAVPDTGVNRMFTNADPERVRPVVDHLGDVSRRYIDDLPAPGIQSNAFAIVCAYSIFGLSDADIAFLLKIELGVLENLKLSPAYGNFMEAMLQNIREHDSNEVRRKINRAASKAVDKVIQLADSDSEKISLAAAQDILNRAGHTQANITNNSKDMMQGITIRILDEKEETRVEVDIDA